MAKEKIQTEKKIKEKVSKKAEAPKVKKKIFAKKEKPAKTQHTPKAEKKHPKQRKSQIALDEKKAKLAVAGRQTKWAPVWVVMKKYGMGKRIHPSAMTHYRRSWRRNKLNIKPRRMRKWHMG